MTVALIDNYDSFTHNLFQLLGEEGATTAVFRNDAIDLAGLIALAPSHIVLSPGPGHPKNARDLGVCRDAIHHFGPSTPLLGVCLGDRKSVV
jgi:anthranilate/para-aminobenzoate synthase component II